jgi:endoglucanase
MGTGATQARLCRREGPDLPAGSPATKLYSLGRLRYPSAMRAKRGLRTALILLSLCAGSLSIACGRSQGGASPSANVPSAPSAAVTGNPFAGIEIYRAPYSNAENAQRQAEKENPAEAALLAKIASQPQASWYGSWSADIQTVVSNYVNAAERAGQLALLVAYNVPNRDCGQYSAGGASDSGAYLKWIEAFAAGIGERRAVVVLEPDAVPLLEQCLSKPDQGARLELIARAVAVLSARPGVSLYIDAGHSSWIPAPVMADRLKRAGIEQARGFALNTSNYREDEELIKYGKDLIGALGIETHFIIDSSRNGNGPAPPGDEDWCNPEGRALGRAPTTQTSEPSLDAFVWIKRPGESDGECKGGPAAGQWFQQRGVEMARNAKW